jgi:hypothetical protein
VNFNVNYEFSDTLRGFLETKYVRAETMTFTEQDAFYDTLGHFARQRVSTGRTSACHGSSRVIFC